MQLTSGSTGSPKAVQITHANIVANAEAMFSMLFANASAPVPTSQPPRDRVQAMITRATTSSVRWKLMVRRM